MTMTDDKAFGATGEREAAAYLQEKGYTLCCLNYRAATGEIDIIAEDGRTVVFVEVKARRSLDYGLPAEAVFLIKRQKIIQTAQFYLNRYNRWDRPCRFDVIEIFRPPGRSSLFRHITHAFSVE